MSTGHSQGAPAPNLPALLREVRACTLCAPYLPLGPRPVLTDPGADNATTPSAYLPLTRVRPAGVVWHPVPTVLGVNARRAQRFATAWHVWTGGGAAVYTRTPEGAGILAAARGTAPLASGSVLRLDWS